MEQTNNTTPTNAGKGLGVAGFVIALVALVLWIFVSGAAVLSAIAGGGMGLAIFWILVSATGLTLSVMGFMKAKAGNGKKGLAIAGLVCGILATGLSVRTVFAVKQAHEQMAEMGLEANNLMNKLEEGMKEGLQQAMDSMQVQVEEAAAATDSTATH
jgi:FtsH-binding integral membrane protein